MSEYFIVWNADRSEGFITDNADDASKAAGRMHVGGIESALGERFRDLYSEDGKAEVQPFIIHKPLSKAAEKLYERIRNGHWVDPYSKNVPKCAQELVDHGLISIAGRVETVRSAYVAKGHTPYVMDRAPGER